MIEHLEHADASRTFLVAHSHGGNVVTYASARSVFVDQVAGIVFLGTPFLFFSRRTDAALWEKRIIPFLAPFLSYALFGLGVLPLASLEDVDVAKNVGEVASDILALMGVIYLIFMFWLLRHMLRHLDEYLGRMFRTYAEKVGAKAQLTCEEFRQPQLSGRKTFICQCSFDEASIWLRSIVAILDVARGIYSFAALVFRYPLRSIAIIGIFGSVLLYVFGAAQIFRGLSSVFSLYVLIYSSALGLLLTSTIIIKYLSRLLLNQPFSFGADHFVDNLVMDVSTRKSPNLDGAEPQSFISYSRLPIRFLNHCSYYLDDSAIGAISQWMNERLNCAGDFSQPTSV